MSSAKLYLAFDLSTQSLTAVITNEALQIISQESISFDTDLREFATENGVHRHADGRTITSPTLMWVKALDILMMKMMLSGVRFQDVCMISGTAQQHGSVYWAHSAEMTLNSLDFNAMLADQLQSCFAVNDSPVWMDSSTQKQCAELEAAAGGAEQLAAITGSKAYERFTGTQIAKLHQSEKKVYTNCERITLISNFLATLFLGGYAPIDYSDASGMNLFNIQTKQWEPKLMDACAPGLAPRLGVPVASSEIIGKVSPYIIDRYNFSPECSIVAFTGDNPASLVGMRLGDSDVAVSLGTSDTLIFWKDTAALSAEGHMFVSPVDKNEFMALLCFKNGSLSRELVCNRCCNASWEKFNQSLQQTPAGNHGNLGIYFNEMEILPHAKGVYRWNEHNQFISSFENDVEVRAVVEGQFLAKRYHAEKFGFNPVLNSRILATGGASNNESILQILCDIFNCPVYTLQETSNSACLGCIYRCVHARAGDGKTNYYNLIKDINPHKLVCSPNPDNVQTYNNLYQRYGTFEEAAVEISLVKYPKPKPLVVVPPEKPVSTTEKPNEKPSVLVKSELLTSTDENNVAKDGSVMQCDNNSNGSDKSDTPKPNEDPNISDKCESVETLMKCEKMDCEKTESMVSP